MLVLFVVTLNELNKKESIALACAKLGVRALPAAVQKIITTKTQGHPLYIEELVRSMLEEELIEIDDDGNCVLSQRLQNDANSAFPDNVQGVIVGRIDRLPSELQMTLKVCAVIGLQVSIKLLKADRKSVV